MSNDSKDAKFKKWLDILQQESWQLELIISGFAIYGLFLIIDPIKISVVETQEEQNMYAGFLFQGLLVSWYIIATNLLAHVILRGLWIGAVGLRYVSGDIDYQMLRYSPKFSKHLKKRVGSFDNYVAKLEKYCSIIFAVTFLLVFYLLGILIIVALLNFISMWMYRGEVADYRNWIGAPLMIFLIIGSILTFIDFITQGWLKRKKWTTFFYYPIYWVFKYLTLSFLYRPMVYNFLDTRFGKRLSYIIVPLYIGIGILAGTGFSTSNYLDDENNSSSSVANIANYHNLIEEKTDFVYLASVPSKVIKDPFLEVFIVYGSPVEDDVFDFYEHLKPKKDHRGLYTPFSQGTVDWSDKNRLLPKYVQALEEMYQLKIDSTYFEPSFVLTKNKRNQKGYETFLDLKEIPRGKHLLEIKRKDKIRDSIYFRKIISIPFWYYPE